MLSLAFLYIYIHTYIYFQILFTYFHLCHSYRSVLAECVIFLLLSHNMIKNVLTVRRGVVDEDHRLARFSQDPICRHSQDQVKAFRPLQLRLTQVIQDGDPERLHADARGEVQVLADAHVI